MKYEKVRDCTGVHLHEFPGKEPKIMVNPSSNSGFLRIQWNLVNMNSRESSKTVYNQQEFHSNSS